MPGRQFTQRFLHLRKGSRIPQGSVFFEKVVPILLIMMGILMALLVFFAAGVILGFIRF